MTLDLKDRLYTSSEVAEILGVSLRSVYRYLEEGKLDADIKTATGRHRFSKKNILDFLQPGGITKENPEEVFKNLEDDEEFNVLDLPAISKSKKSSDKDEDDFSFDLDEDFFKSLNFDNQPTENIQHNQPNSSSKVEQGEYIDDDLEKLLREFEEKEGFETSDSKPMTNLESPKNSSDKDDFDFDLDSFFKDLEEESRLDKVEDTQSPSMISQSQNTSENKNKNVDDFDFDFDLSFLDSFDSDNNSSNKKEEVVEDRSVSQRSEPKIEEDDSEDNWLERFRKAAQKNSNNTESSQNKDTLKESFFEKSNLDHFFDDSSVNKAKEETSTIGFQAHAKTENDLEPLQVKSKEFYYTSSLNGLKEIAQNVDKIARKFDTDYAFTLNAGLSLHKPISPFSLIHTYVRSRDLELFEDYLNLSPVDSASEASVCLMVAQDNSIFEDAYELHGLYVVSNVQLRSDLIDKGLDRLAREI